MRFPERQETLRLIGSLFLIATATAVLVAVADSLGLMLRYAGGRARETGFGWMLHLAFLTIQTDLYLHFPAFVRQYFELGNWQQLLRFLLPAITLNVGISWAGAAVLCPPLLWLSSFGDRSRQTGRVPLWKREYPLAVWVVFFSPLVMHLLCGVTIIGLGIHHYVTRVLLGGGLSLLLWGGLRILMRRERRMARFVRAMSVTGLAVGGLVAVGGGALGLLEYVRLSGLEAAAKASGPNILLVSIDSLRGDHLHAYGYPRQTSPAMDALAKDGVLFENAVSPTSWTLPAHMTMLTSLPQHQHQVTTDLLRLNPKALTLAEVLSGAGYATAAFVSGPYMRAEYGYFQGFGRYDDHTALTLINDALSAVTSPALVGLTRSWLQDWDDGGRGKPFFIFLHMWDVHYDYVPPPPYDTLFDPDYRGSMTARNFRDSPSVHAGMDPRDLEHIVALYDGEIRFTDHHLGLLFDDLESLGVFDDTIIVVTSDHGDEFFEHGRKGHRNTLYEEVIRVPLIIRFPAKAPAGTVVTEQVRLMDLAPTLLSLAGVDQPREFGMQGGLRRHLPRNLSPLFDPKQQEDFIPIIAFGNLEGLLASVRSDTLKLIVRPRGRRRPELYDLSQDPEEQANLGEQRTAELEALYQELVLFERASSERSPARSMRLDEEHLETLRSLGYVK